MRAMPLVFAVVYALATAVPSEAGPGPEPAPAAAAAPAALRHIRPRDTVAALFLRFGQEKSARFREIVRALERSNVIVYVEVRQASSHPVGGGLTFIGEANGVRWVRAMVDSGTPSHLATCQDIVRLTSILGHELQHAAGGLAGPDDAGRRRVRALLPVDRDRAGAQDPRHPGRPADRQARRRRAPWDGAPAWRGGVGRELSRPHPRRAVPPPDTPLPRGPRRGESPAPQGASRAGARGLHQQAGS